jgi:hypothetical protein
VCHTDVVKCIVITDNGKIFTAGWVSRLRCSGLPWGSGDAPALSVLQSHSLHLGPCCRSSHHPPAARRCLAHAPPLARIDA